MFLIFNCCWNGAVRRECMIVELVLLKQAWINQVTVIGAGEKRSQDLRVRRIAERRRNVARDRGRKTTNPE